MKFDHSFMNMMTHRNHASLVIQFNIILLNQMDDLSSRFNTTNHANRCLLNHKGMPSTGKLHDYEITLIDSISKSYGNWIITLSNLYFKYIT